MDHFKADGNLTLELPLAPGFEKLFKDFLRITLSKCEFSASDSDQIAERVLESLKRKTAGREDSSLLVIVVSHRPRNVRIRAHIEALNIAEDLQFTAS